jgi:hypothetical protein
MLSPRLSPARGHTRIDHSRRVVPAMEAGVSDQVGA